MRVTGLVVLASLAAAASLWLLVTGWRDPRPLLDDALSQLRRSAPGAHTGDRRALDRLGASRLVPMRFTSSNDLVVIGRSPQTHAGYLAAAALVGLVVPSAVAAGAVLVGAADLGFTLPAAASLLGAIAAPALVHAAATNKADEIRIDLRHQLSAYLDMVTMLLAGNTGHEGALEQAATAGDGLLFRELRRRMREVSTTGNSLVGALALVADDFELSELEQVAAATTLSAAEGAPVARTLAAKCSTLRSTLAADQEARARVRNDKVTPPLVGMALLFMALIIYPALNIA